MIRLSKKEFRAWLQSRRGSIVGDPTECYDCPIFHYLKSKGAEKVYVEPVFRRVDGAVHEHSPWQRDFQHHAVELKETLGVDALRGGEALEALARTD